MFYGCLTWVLLRRATQFYFKDKSSFKMKCASLKNKIENNSTWEGAFYQSEWAKINSSWVT